MGNKSSSPAYSYDAVCSMLSPDELTALKRKFKELCGNSRANGAGLLDMNAFVARHREGTCKHLIDNFFPRLFFVIAGGKDASTIKFEEYVGALTLFRLGKKEDQLKCACE